MKGDPMKVYIASSWKMSEWVIAWKEALEKEGHEVDAFCDDSDMRYVFYFSEIGDPANLDAINFLADPRSRRAFEEDKKWLDWADVCLLVLPSGKSAHLEAGYAKGQGKLLIIWQNEFPKGEFDVMYGFADLITNSALDVVNYLAGKEAP